MRQSHAAGEKVFVDFAGDTIDVVDPSTGEVRPMKLFVAAMGASSYIFAQARPSEQIADWIGAHVDLFAFLGGAPKFVVCDNLKAAVTNPDRYEPGLNRSYLEFADHYGVAILPARPYKPRDKAKVEQSGLIAERWILARLRNQRFFSAADLNIAIAERVGDINARVMKGYDASRVELFTAIDKPALKSLPDEPYAFAVWKRCRVAPDYHVEVDGHWYSTPFRLIRELVDVRVADKTVEIFYKGQRVASHPRAPNRRGHTTIAEHMPSAHRRHAAWTPARVMTYAEKIGPSTAALCEAVMTARPHPEQGFRTCLGILALTRTYGAARVDAACRRGVSINARSVASIRSILKNGLDRAFLDEDGRSDREPVRHPNIRGRNYFH
jgi:transposase